MKISFIIISCLLYVAVQGCGSMSVTSSSGGGGGTPSSETGTVDGKVFDSQVQPLSKVLITINGNPSSAESGIDGSYIIPKAPVGTYKLNASKTGYISISNTVTVSAESITTQDFTLFPTGKPLGNKL